MRNLRGQQDTNCQVSQCESLMIRYFAAPLDKGSLEKDNKNISELDLGAHIYLVLMGMLSPPIA